MAYEKPTEVVASAARTASGQSGTLDCQDAENMAYEKPTEVVASAAENLSLLVDVTAVTGTTPTLDLSVEWSSDNGTTWFKADTADTLAQITAAKKTAKRFSALASWFRVVWTIGGTTPSFTFAVDRYLT